MPPSARSILGFTFCMCGGIGASVQSVRRAESAETLEAAKPDASGLAAGVAPGAREGAVRAPRHHMRGQDE